MRPVGSAESPQIGTRRRASFGSCLRNGRGNVVGVEHEQGSNLRGKSRGRMSSGKSHDERSAATRLVLAERERQDAKWGEQNHADEWWLAILTEEVGELSEAILHARFGGPAAENVEEELVHVAAVAFQWIESMQRRITCEQRNEIASAAIPTADHFGVNGKDTRV